MTEEKEAALDYFRRMRVEPTPYGILRWIYRSMDKDADYDRKYARRLIEALIMICGGDPAIAYDIATREEFEGGGK